MMLLTSLEIAGRPYPLSCLGADQVTGIELAPDQNQLRIGFAAAGPDNGDPLSFQYKLNGGDWSDPAPDPMVSLAGLRPGSHRFAVCALSPDPGPVARISFHIAPPLWQRWWFIAAAVLSIAAIAYQMQRLRFGQLLAVERMRTRIATDLHDDIGSSLSQIAIMTELAQRSGDRASVAEIGSLSRDLVDAMGDIVWAINPKHDHLNNLLHRMRRFAEDTLGARDIQLQFHTKGMERDIRAPADVRRQVFLVFKEAVANIAKHSGAHHAIIALEAEGAALRLSIADDGRGFDSQRTYDGNGLGNMRERIRKLGGTLDLTSQPGKGTAIVVTARLGGQPTVAG